MTRERSVRLAYRGDEDGREHYFGTTGSGRTITYGGDVAAGELSPVEMLVANLAGCSAMDVWSIAKKKRQPISRYEVAAVATQRDEYPQILTEVTVTHEVWGPSVSETAISRAIELSATKYCPVNAMLSAGATQVHHRYVIHDTSDASTAGSLVITTGPYQRPDIVR